jgi:geranylgeranyl diphosphate synthase type I
MKDYILKNKKSVNKYLTDFLKEKGKELSKINRWGKDVPKRLSSFVTQGKAIRANMILLSYQMYGGIINKNAIKTASAIELFHSSLLIHDDIVDEDKKRRGGDTIFAQYEKLGKKETSLNPRHFGESLGICAGDIGFFWGFEIISNLKLEPRIKNELISIYSKELVLVGLGEMQDIYLGSISKKVTKKDVYNVHLYKTARYTFSLPLMIGATLAGKKSVLNKLSDIGELIGLIFQIKDDELGLFGDEKQIGKPVGSDIKEGKKTLYHLYLMEKATKEERQKLNKIFGNNKIGKKEIDYVRNLVKKYKIDQKIDKNIINYYKKAEKMIKNLSGKTKYKNILLEILKYNLKRKK